MRKRKGVMHRVRLDGTRLNSITAPTRGRGEPVLMVPGVLLSQEDAVTAAIVLTTKGMRR